MNRETGKLLVDAGADVLVAGSAVFGAPDPVAEVAALKGALVLGFNRKKRQLAVTTADTNSQQAPFSFLLS